MHPPDDRPRTTRELRSFAFTVGVAFMVLATLLYLRGRAPASAVCAVMGNLLVIAGVLIPSRLGGAYRAWMGLAHAMSRVTTPVFMAVVFFGVLMPLGLVRRMFGRGALGTPRDAWTGWVRRAPGATRGDMRRQF